MGASISICGDPDDQVPKRSQKLPETRPDQNLEAKPSSLHHSSEIIDDPIRLSENNRKEDSRPVEALLCVVCNVDRWAPSLKDWATALGFITDTTITDRIHRYHKGFPSPDHFPRHTHPDTKCFALGRLLTQQFVAQAVGDGTRPRDAVIRRTAEGKPYADYPSLLKTGWNINMSHGGSLVVMACGSCGGVIGADVMPVELVPVPRNQPTDAASGLAVVTIEQVTEFFSDFATYFTKREWGWIQSKPSTPHIELTRFYVLWTLKESYIKAVGIGLGFELQRAEFTFVRPLLSANDSNHMVEADVTDPDFFLPVERALKGPPESIRSAPGAPPALHGTFSPLVSLAIDGISQTGLWRFALFAYRGENVMEEGTQPPSASRGFFRQDYVGAVALGPYEDANVSSYGQVVQQARTCRRQPVALHVFEMLGSDIVEKHSQV